MDFETFRSVIWIFSTILLLLNMSWHGGTQWNLALRKPVFLPSVKHGQAGTNPLSDLYIELLKIYLVNSISSLHSALNVQAGNFLTLVATSVNWHNKIVIVHLPPGLTVNQVEEVQCDSYTCGFTHGAKGFYRHGKLYKVMHRKLDIGPSRIMTWSTSYCKATCMENCNWLPWFSTIL